MKISFTCSSKAHLAQRIALSLTVGRLILALPLVSAVRPGHRQLSVVLACLVVVILADIYDGKAARNFHVDGVLRRIVDPVVDRITMHLALLFASLGNTSLFAFCVLLAIRDVAQGAIGLSCVKRGVLLLGSGWHKAYCLSGAAFLLAIVHGGRWEAVVGIWFGVGSLTVLYDYLRMSRKLSTVAGHASFSHIRIQRGDTHPNGEVQGTFGGRQTHVLASVS
jgi:phosphatidylglycerophosphate synthase